MSHKGVTAIYSGPLENYDAAAASARFGLYAELYAHGKPTLLVRVTRLGEMQGMPQRRHFSIETKDAEGNVYEFVAYVAGHDYPYTGRLELVEMVGESTLTG